MVSLPDRVDVRLAVNAEIPRLATIDASTEAQFVDAGHPEFANGGTIPDAEARSAIERNHLWVAEIDAQIVGWLVLTRTGDEPCIGQVAVLPEHQGQGVGTALTQLAIEAAGEQGERSVVLSTQVDVAWNQPWYEKLGFVVVPEGEWTPAMRAETASQEQAGLDWSTRVHMRVSIR